MATMSAAISAPTAGDRFYWHLALAMAAAVVAGFSINLVLGRSTFSAPLVMHLHAVAFMGWVALFLLQSHLASRGPIALHRRLGWIGAVLVLALVILGIALTIDRLQRGATPFFFRPQEFLFTNSLGVLGFAALTWAAVAMRRRTDWHSRLQICAMATIMGPAFGRLLPMPFLIPWAFEAATVAGLVFPVIGMLRDKRSNAIVHPAWWVGIAVALLTVLVGDIIAQTSLGDALYAWVTAGTPGALLEGMAFPQAPAL